MSSENNDLILAVNAGSSSLKISLYRLSHSVSGVLASEPVELLLVSDFSNITAPPATFSFKFTAAAPRKGRDANHPPCCQNIRQSNVSIPRPMTQRMRYRRAMKRRKDERGLYPCSFSPERREVGSMQGMAGGREGIG